MSATERGGEAGGTDAGGDGWPQGSVVAGLVASEDPSESRDAAIRYADRLGREGRALLVNLEDPGRALDRRLGGGEEPGLRDLRGGGLTLRDLARRPSGHHFLYLPAGEPEPGSGDTPPVEDPRILGLLGKVAERVRERGGRLLLHLGRRDRWPEEAGRLVDVVVLLQGGRPPAGTPEGLPVLEPPSGEGPEAPPGRGAGVGAGERPGAGEDGPGGEDRYGGDVEGPGEDRGRPPGEASGWRRHRRSSGPPWGRIALGAAVVAALAGGWWWLAARSAPAPGGGEAPAAEEAPGVRDSAPSPGAPGREDPAGAGDTGPGGEADGAPSRPDPGEAAARAPELPFSVLIASYAEWSQARERLDRWGGDDEGPVYFAAPTTVRGRVYWRLFAGALPDRAAAEALMERLVEEGRKDRARSWDVRPVARAFREGVYPSRDVARDRADELRERGLPAYALAAAAGPDTVWPLYLGGYESAEAAAPLERRLRDAEIEAELVTRRGESDIR